MILQTLSVKLYISCVGRHGGWGRINCVWCKTISYQDNISNSIYDSQEPTPGISRNLKLELSLLLNLEEVQ